jgi:hypothetical protein
MTAVALSILRTRSKRRADMENASFVGDAEWLDYINEGAKRLHELLVGAYGEDYFKKTSAFNTANGTSDYPLPSDFFKLTGVDLTVNSKPVSLKRFMEPERNAFRNVSAINWFSVPRYKLEGNNLRLYPAPASVLAGVIIYIPVLQVLVGGSTFATSFVNDSDTCDFPNGWDKFITAYAAEQALMKEESSTREIRSQLDRWEAELVAMASDRDAANSVQAVDHDLEDLDPRWW